MTVIELYELAKKHNLEDYDIVIEGYDEDGWWDEHYREISFIEVDWKEKRVRL